MLEGRRPGASPLLVRGIALNLEEDNVGIVLLGATEQVKEGDRVESGDVECIIFSGVYFQ